MLDNVFKYSEESPTGLVWNITILAGEHRNVIKTIPGQIAGSKADRKWNVVYNNVTYACHRVVWEIFNGKLQEGFVIDHKDGNPFNNKIENLRAVNQRVNTQNAKLSNANTSGKKGVSLHQGRYWKAQWYDKGRLKTKYFSIVKYGYQKAFDLASEYRDIQIEILNTNGEAYSDRHLNRSKYAI